MSVHTSLTSLLKESIPEFLRAAEFCVTHHKKLESPEENEHSILGYPAAALLFCIADTIGSYHHGKRNFTVPLDGKQVSIASNGIHHFYIFNTPYYHLP